jgi:hypothetical protein
MLVNIEGDRTWFVAINPEETMFTGTGRGLRSV